MKASRGAPWLQVTRGSPERLRMRRAREFVSGGRGAGIEDASALGAVHRVTALASRTVTHSLLSPPPPLAVSGFVTCSLARWGSGAISGLGGRGRLTSDSDDSANKGNYHPDVQSILEAESSPLSLKRFSSRPLNHLAPGAGSPSSSNSSPRVSPGDTKANAMVAALRTRLGSARVASVPASLKTIILSVSNPALLCPSLWDEG